MVSTAISSIERHVTGFPSLVDLAISTAMACSSLSVKCCMCSPLLGVKPDLMLAASLDLSFIVRGHPGNWGCLLAGFRYFAAPIFRPLHTVHSRRLHIGLPFAHLPRAFLEVQLAHGPTALFLRRQSKEHLVLLALGVLRDLLIVPFPRLRPWYGRLCHAARTLHETRGRGQHLYSFIRYTWVTARTWVIFCSVGCA